MGDGLAPEAEEESQLTGPEMVPEASRSPGLMLHPVTVWCASCCFIVQYLVPAKWKIQSL